MRELLIGRAGRKEAGLFFFYGWVLDNMVLRALLVRLHINRDSKEEPKKFRR
jgi:hypothetical protein